MVSVGSNSMLKGSQELMDDDSLLLDDNRRSIFPGCEPRMFSVSGDHTLRQWNVKTGRLEHRKTPETCCVQAISRGLSWFEVVFMGFKPRNAAFFESKQLPKLFTEVSSKGSSGATRQRCSACQWTSTPAWRSLAPATRPWLCGTWKRRGSPWNSSFEARKRLRKGGFEPLKS